MTDKWRKNNNGNTVTEHRNIGLYKMIWLSELTMSKCFLVSFIHSYTVYFKMQTHRILFWMINKRYNHNAICNVEYSYISSTSCTMSSDKSGFKMQLIYKYTPWMINYDPKHNLLNKLIIKLSYWTSVCRYGA